jgi:hypothetical protein
VVHAPAVQAGRVLDPSLASNPYLGMLVPRTVIDRHLMEDSAASLPQWKTLPDLLPTKPCAPAETSVLAHFSAASTIACKAELVAAHSPVFDRPAKSRLDEPASADKSLSNAARAAGTAPVLRLRSAGRLHERARSSSSDDSGSSFRSALHGVGQAIDNMERHTSSWWQ